MRSAAHLSIPQTAYKSYTKIVSYWSNELDNLRNLKQHHWREFKRARTEANLISYKKANAIFRKKSKEAKRMSFEKLTAEINPCSNPKKIWSDIKMLSGSYTQNHIKFINSPTGPILDPKEKLNTKSQL